MDHRPYPKVPLRSDAVAGGPWVATEKLHGAHLVVACDGAEVLFGKRKAWLAPDEPFFGWQLLRRELEVAVREAWRRVGAATPLRVHGELIGGAYPHPDVAPVPGLGAVQTGCWYCPELRFVAFDALSDDDFLSFTELERLGFELPPVLRRGARGDLALLPVEFPSRYATRRGLPWLDGNFAEGMVLKPDARWCATARPSLKRKHPRFDDAKFDESAAWESRTSLDHHDWTALVGRLVNDARLASARSKVGEGNLIDEVVLDVLLDLEAFQPTAFACADAEHLADLVRSAALAKSGAEEAHAGAGH